MISVKDLREICYKNDLIKCFEEQIDNMLEENASKGVARTYIYELKDTAQDTLKVSEIQTEYLRTLESLYSSEGFKVELKKDKNEYNGYKHMKISF